MMIFKLIFFKQKKKKRSRKRKKEESEIYEDILQQTLETSTFHRHRAGGVILCATVQAVINTLKKRVEEFEQNYSEMEKESHARLSEAEEAQTRASQLQETIERYLIPNNCISWLLIIISCVMTISN